MSDPVNHPEHYKLNKRLFNMLNRKVQVYRNINKGGLSIKCNGLVVGHCDHIQMEGVSLHVNKAGAERIIKGGNKEVVAWATGWWTECNGFTPYKGRSLPPVTQRYTFECVGWDKNIYFNPTRGVNWLDDEGYIIESLGWLEIFKTGFMVGAEA
jgi:hypothetical protein